jgi:putative ABC transport system permease protein
VSEAARIQIERGLSIRAEAQASNTDAVALADPSVFKIFTFPFVRGDAATALDDKFAVVLTERMARKYFGASDPVGRTLRVNGEFDVRVSGVIRDVPTRSSLRFDAVVPFALQFAPSFEEPTHWGGNPLETWVLLAPGADRTSVEAKITAIAATHFSDAAGRVDFRVQPLLRKRLYAPDGTGLIRSILLFSGAALFILALACQLHQSQHGPGGDAGQGDRGPQGRGRPEGRHRSAVPGRIAGDGLPGPWGGRATRGPAPAHVQPDRRQGAVLRRRIEAF